MIKAKKFLYFLVAIHCAGVSGGMVKAAGNPDAGEKTFQACTRCHNHAPAKDADRQHIPRLGGQHAEYVISSLESYVSGERKHPGMKRIADSLSTQNKKDIAAYVAQFELKKFPVPEPGKPIAIDKIIESCRVCHGVRGNSFVADYPRINGQDGKYLLKALKGYRNGTRKNPTMVYVVKDLTEKELIEIADYYSTQRKGLTVIGK